MNRFDTCNGASIQKFIDKSKNQYTTKATSQWIRVYNAWAVERDAPSDFERLNPVAELDQLLQQFYAEVKNKTVMTMSPHEHNSLSSL